MILPTKRDAAAIRQMASKLQQSRGAGVHNSPGAMVTGNSPKRERLNDPMPFSRILFGTPTTAYSSGSTITLQPCDSNGVSTGAATVTVQAGWTLPTVIGTALTIPTTAIIPFQAAQPVGSAAPLYYVIGQPGCQIVTDTQISGGYLQKKIRYTFGTFASAESDWQNTQTILSGLTTTTQVVATSVDYSLSTQTLSYHYHTLTVLGNADGGDTDVDTAVDCTTGT